MERAEKSLGIAYLFWLLVGIWGGHRFYLRQHSSAILMVAMHVAGWICVILSPQMDSVGMTWIGVALLAAVVAWVLVDAVFLPSMVADWNDRVTQHEGPFMPGSFSNDPGFQATLAKAGASAPPRSGKRAIPDGYEMPWRRNDEGTPQSKA